MEIKLGHLDHPAVINLLQEHHQDMLQHSPPESVHALDLTSLKAPDVSFWTLWQGERLAGCGAVKQLSSAHGEIKSMRTAKDFKRQGVAAQILQHIITQAKQNKISRLSLETGTMAAFQPAHRLYQKYGFVECPPFGDYQEDPYSTFMTLALPDK